MRPESAGHRRAPLIEPRSSQLPAVHGPSSPAALRQPRGLQLPAHTEPHQSGLSGRTPRQGGREGRVGIGEVKSVSEREERKEGEQGAWMEESLISS